MPDDEEIKALTIGMHRWWMNDYNLNLNRNIKREACWHLCIYIITAIVHFWLYFSIDRCHLHVFHYRLFVFFVRWKLGCCLYRCQTGEDVFAGWAAAIYIQYTRSCRIHSRTHWPTYHCISCLARLVALCYNLYNMWSYFIDKFWALMVRPYVTMKWELCDVSCMGQSDVGLHIGGKDCLKSKIGCILGIRDGWPVTKCYLSDNLAVVLHRIRYISP